MGIGAAIAEHLAQAGAHLALLARSEVSVLAGSLVRSLDNSFDRRTNYQLWPKY
jgi:short-subunit dehydrogenase